MSNQPKTSNKPTHRVYAVTKRGEKSHWQDVGAAWAHKDQKGLSLKLDYLPLNGAEIVLRVPDPVDVTASDATAVNEGGY